eukprot:Colp12_sorted_trinity150504_noHs@11917
MEEILGKDFDKFQEDAIECWVYPHIPTDVEDVEAFLQAAATVYNDYIQKIAGEHIWQKDGFRLTVRRQENSASFALYNKSRVGDNIEDEWFITYLLFELSKAHPEIVISTSDTDGEFLLIEAADVLPSWLDPDTSINRVFLH